MKHIKSVNEFFDFLRKDDEEDQIASGFVSRLEKAKMGQNPYEIKLVKCGGRFSTIPLDGNVPEYITSDIYDKIYVVTFDDVDLASCAYPNLRGGGTYYTLYIDGEQIHCKDKYQKSIFNLVNEIYQSDTKRKKLDKVRRNINPAADLL